MTSSELERYLHEHMPLSRLMQVRVASAAREGIVLEAPLAPNINHRETVFGGSASALGILAAWSLLHLRLQGEGLASRLVIQRNTMDYVAPMAGTFQAASSLADPSDWSRFLRMLQRKGTGRITVRAVLRCGGEVGGRLEGDFVALRIEPASHQAGQLV